MRQRWRLLKCVFNEAWKETWLSYEIRSTLLVLVNSFRTRIYKIYNIYVTLLQYFLMYIFGVIQKLGSWKHSKVSEAFSIIKLLEVQFKWNYNTLLSNKQTYTTPPPYNRIDLNTIIIKIKFPYAEVIKDAAV